MTRYGEWVPYWVTFNEPNIGYGWLYTTYNGLRQIILAHATVYEWYKMQLLGTGQITIKLSNTLAMPLDPSNPSHISAALRCQDFDLGIVGNPLFLGKQFPTDTLTTPNVNLSALTDEEIAWLHGKIDFFAIDSYVSQYASPSLDMEACMKNSSDPLWPTCVTLTNVQANGWLMGDASSSYPYIAPQYMRQQLGYIWNTFRPSGILISEFGFPEFAESSNSVTAQRYDLDRTLYYQTFLREILMSIQEDGVHVLGTLAWSFVDNNEWGDFATQFGMQLVNRTNGLLTRTYKRGIFDFVDFFQEHVDQ